jgi:hypothetical protein
MTTNHILEVKGRRNKKITKALKDMTISELEKENQKLMAEKEAIRDKQRLINSLISKLSRKEDKQNG